MPAVHAAAYFVIDSMMTLHYVALSHTQTTREFSCCAYSQKIRLLCRMLTRLGWRVVHYGVEGSEVECEHISVLDAETWARTHRAYDWRTAGFNTDPTLDTFKAFEAGAIAAIGERKQPGDLLLLPLGMVQKAIADAHPDLTVVEPGIGYGTTFARYRVFESYAWMHHTLGRECQQQPLEVRRWAGITQPTACDAVIPNYLDLADFPVADKREDYVLHLGRAERLKGLGWAVAACRLAGARLLVAGQGHAETTDYEYLGVLSIEERARVLSRARCLIAPTLYLEPFGTVAIDAAACGVPAITTDWGGFTETVEQGVTGFRCRSPREMAEAIQRADEINPAECRWRAERLYSLEAVAPMYDRYLRAVVAHAGGDAEALPGLGRYW